MRKTNPKCWRWAVLEGIPATQWGLELTSSKSAHERLQLFTWSCTSTYPSATAGFSSLCTDNKMPILDNVFVMGEKWFSNAKTTLKFQLKSRRTMAAVPYFWKINQELVELHRNILKVNLLSVPRLSDTESKRDYILIFHIQKRLISLQGCILFSAKFNKLWPCINEILKRKWKVYSVKFCFHGSVKYRQEGI